jgi:hypothetical protein
MFDSQRYESCTDVHAGQLYEKGLLSVAVSVTDDDCSSGSKPLWIIGVVVGGIILLLAVTLVVGYFLHKRMKVHVFYSMLWSPEGSGYYRKLEEVERYSVL